MSRTDTNEMRSQRKATVPFLLQLAYLSPTLLNAMCQDIRKTREFSSQSFDFQKFNV